MPPLRLQQTAAPRINAAELLRQSSNSFNKGIGAARGVLNDYQSGVTERKNKAASLITNSAFFDADAEAKGLNPDGTLKINQNPLQAVNQSNKRKEWYDAFIAEGYPPHIAEGFTDNIGDESGFNSSIVEKTPNVHGTRGKGGYQLTGTRRTDFENIFGNDYSISNQVKNISRELGGPESAAAKKIFASKTRGEAGSAVVKHFLRPAKKHQLARSAKYLAGDKNRSSKSASQILQEGSSTSNTNIPIEGTQENPTRITGSELIKREEEGEFIQTEEESRAAVALANANSDSRTSATIAREAERQAQSKELNRSLGFDVSQNPNVDLSVESNLTAQNAGEILNNTVESFLPNSSSDGVTVQNRNLSQQIDEDGKNQSEIPGPEDVNIENTLDTPDTSSTSSNPVVDTTSFPPKKREFRGPAYAKFWSTLKNDDTISLTTKLKMLASIDSSRDSSQAEAKAKRADKVNNVLQEAYKVARASPDNITLEETTNSILNSVGNQLTAEEYNIAAEQIAGKYNKSATKFISTPTLTEDGRINTAQASFTAQNKRALDSIPGHELVKIVEEFGDGTTDVLIEKLTKKLELNPDEFSRDSFLWNLFIGDPSRNEFRKYITSITNAANANGGGNITNAQTSAAMLDMFNRDPYGFNTNENRFGSVESAAEFVKDNLGVEAMNRYEGSKQAINNRINEYAATKLQWQVDRTRLKKIKDKNSSKATALRKKINKAGNYLRAGVTPNESFIKLADILQDAGIRASQFNKTNKAAYNRQIKRLKDHIETLGIPRSEEKVMFDLIDEGKIG